MHRGRFVPSTILIVLFGSGLAQAQEGLDSERFKPAMDSQGIILTEGGQGEEALDFNIGFYIHYSRNPMVIRSGDDVIHNLVAHRLSGNLFGSMGITDWLAVGVDIPAVFYQSGALLDDGNSTGLTSAALGDIRVAPKLTALREESFGVSLALHVPVSLPSGDDGAFVGSKTVSASPTIAASRHFFDDRMMVALNVGVWLQDEGSYHELEVGHEMFYRIGAGFCFAEGLWAMGEVSAAGKLVTLFENKPQEAPLEWLMGLRYHGPWDLIFTAGGAVGGLPGWGTPNFRGFFGLTWAPREHDQDEDGILDDDDRCPTDPGPIGNGGCPWGDADRDDIKDNLDRCPNRAGPAENGGCPWGDADGDGIKDNVDKCPKAPGPAENGGCPWGDADEDGVLDNVDKCPEEPGPAENAGCPWGDIDGDGIKDNVDKCPKEREDPDGFEDEDGCPDPDNDKDGIPDKDDKCPDKPETINGYKDEDGCPDKGRVVVIVKKEKIEILQKVHFAYAKARILPDSYSLLNQVALVLRAHPEIKKLRVEGHTDSAGPDASNQKLSEQRAEAVMDYMVNRGVDPNRLEAKGYGESMPISSNKTARGRAVNRRVEFMILERE